MKQYNVYMKSRGFTIVELIVVITSIAILASITAVSYSSSRDNAMDARIRSTARTVGDAIALYESKNGNLSFPEGALGQSGGADDTLIPSYLRTGYRNDITSKNVASANDIFVWYSCNDGSGGFVVYASLNRPAVEDTANFSTIRSKCGQTNSVVSSDIYNYAQVF